MPALADGGSGGIGVGYPGGTGGTDSATGLGGTGGDGTFGFAGGGGGGGAGVAGGGGGTGEGQGGFTASGGAGGASAGANGADGSTSVVFNVGGGGGGGGAHGAVVTTTTTNSATVTGGNGGNGGNDTGSAGGGGGGAGGYGVVVNGSGLAYSNSGTVAGGRGGAGGVGFGSGGVSGNGGSGGIGVDFTGSASLVNFGTISGGNGGAAGAGTAGATNGTAGAGGAGIVGAGLTIINSGNIIGGLAGDGVTRANAITFTGGTNVLELWAGSAITGNVVASSAADTLRLGGTTNASFDVSQIGATAQYQGFGVFEKSGSSTWTLTGTNAAAQPWAIDAGTLLVNGTMSSASMTVNTGGTLGGTGTVGSVTVASGGTFAPGTPGSTMTISGNLAFQSGALYLVQVNPTTASSAVTGTANLTGGSVQTVFAAGSYVGKSYDILHASGGITGSFTGVSGNVPAGFSESLSTTTTDVFLNLTATLGQGAGLNGNQQNVAGAINTFFNNGGALPPNFVGVFGLTGGNLSNALTQLSGEAGTGAQQGAFQFMGQFLGLMIDPFADGRGGAPGAGGALGFAPERAALPEDIGLAYARVMKAPVAKAPPPVAFEQRWTAWASGFGGYNSTKGDATVGSHDLTARAGGVAAGLDYRVSRDAVVGFSLAGGGTKWDLAQGFGSGKSDTFAGGVYGAIRSGAAYVAASFGGGNHWMSTDRFAAFGDHLTASFNGESFGGRIEGGYRYGVGSFGVTPYAALQAQSFRTPTYSETDLTGGGFGLTYNGRTASDTRSELGARFDHVALVASDAVLTFRGRLAWAHDWISNPTLAAAFQALPATGFLVNGATPAKDVALVSAGAELRLAKGISLLGKFDGEFAGKAQTYAGTGTVRVNW
ncbi:autotransporter domain-containing protein [Bradyrhizobium sp. CCGUVB1N3]|uniref:autotransporter outer membrane beta-barrel domain-containing protein n=1 Tax=Bradyrhizobium sp. CCGUVB1N3 TaxID=2949629 RepID=UPI0020B224F7|nr:autotransporter outer membrane beta-barrel domain-containing protein [Bradyrhizobium sp. CCGUVB1N3]MCP3470313.1 autotransporter domain-containing protein [Bradyrhizobium sp. CCGUVB1N3]